MDNYHFLIKELKKLINDLELNVNMRVNVLDKENYLFARYQKNRMSYFDFEKRLNKLFMGMGRDEFFGYLNAVEEDLVNKIITINDKLLNIFESIGLDQLINPNNIQPDQQSSYYSVNMRNNHIAKLDVQSDKGVVKSNTTTMTDANSENPSALSNDNKNSVKDVAIKDEIIKANNYIGNGNSGNVNDAKVELLTARIKSKLGSSNFNNKTKQDNPNNKSVTDNNALTELSGDSEKAKKSSNVKFKDVKHSLKHSLNDKADTKLEFEYLDKTIKNSSVFKFRGVTSLFNFPLVILNKLSYNLFKSFPEAFGTLQYNIKASNIKMFTITYISMMLFLTSLSVIIGFPVLVYLFLYLRNVLYIAVMKAFMVSLGFSSALFLYLYYYPQLKVNHKKRNIKANLPFAINHLQAIAQANVEPAKMFELISNTKDYGALSIEFKKISDLIKHSGYDMLSAIKYVSNTTPLKEFREFLEGIISTVEAGGDLVAYLKNQADIASTRYELERQNYIESISTYADIYTGIMIAAPLIIVLALSLISILGGTIAGIDVNTLIILGTYVVIPLLNIVFIIFLELTQPEF